MALYKNKVIELAKSQIGYKESGTNVTKYATYFDTTAWQFFNTKKQGAEWCSLFVHWLFCQQITPNEVRAMFGEPTPKDNCAAGVKYFWSYATKKGLQVKTPQAGDIIFLNDFGHVGIVESVDSQVHTIEGNKGNTVARGTYSKTSSKISGYVRVPYSEEPSPSGGIEVTTRTIYYRKGNLMKGQDVKSVQAIVGATQDGTAGPKTGSKIRSWQKANGLTVDGMFGPACWQFACGAR